MKMEPSIKSDGNTEQTAHAGSFVLLPQEPWEATASCHLWGKGVIIVAQKLPDVFLRIDKFKVYPKS